MWKRDRTVRNQPEDSFARPDETATAASPPAQPPASAASASPKSAGSTAAGFHQSPAMRSSSVLGPTLRFKGDLVADEDLVVQGQVEGSILHTRSLTIGSQGRMQGDIKARRITVEGTVTGDLHAFENATLAAGAEVRGNVFANEVSVAEGARFSGRIDMDNAPRVPQPSEKKPASKVQKPQSGKQELSSDDVVDLLAKP
jgi:cytoskeletal protein CcmA (bactofilin family)